MHTRSVCLMIMKKKRKRFRRLKGHEDPAALLTKWERHREAKCV